MITLFWILWAIDLIIWIVCAFESTTSSNSSMTFPLLIMSAALGLSLYYRASNLKLAMIIAGVPAVLVVGFILLLLFLLITGNGSWQ
jgi:hypothetical protein